MKILLAAINSKFNHTNIAIRSLCKYCSADNVTFDEWTINMSENEILRGLHNHNPDLICFSTYIWNASIIQKLLYDIKKILPSTLIALGGPEATYNAQFYLENFSDVDFIMQGEGEETFKEIVSNLKTKDDILKLLQIKGIYTRDLSNDKKIIFTGERELIENLDELPFPYSSFDEKDTKIYYYESSRGCPFNCAYCMSSLDKKVRFKSLEKVFNELKIFLSNNVKLVKFVDRTYNLNDERYIAIWQYILDNHNGKTMFHFEIEAEFLSDKALNFLQKVPKGMMQFEIGVQSSNPQVLKLSGRSSETKKLAENIKKIPSTIHKHLDLIAALPLEDINSFARSFDFVMDLKPDELQLGFLKVLRGTKMYDYATQNDYQWMQNPPYETLKTPYLSYDDIKLLKDVETLTDVFWNSKLFNATIEYIQSKMSMWQFFYNASKLSRQDKSLDTPKKNLFWFTWLYNNLSKLNLDTKEATEKLKFDYLSIAKTSNFPFWLKRNYDKEKHLEAMINYEKKTNFHLTFKTSDWDIINGKPILFIY